MEQEKMSLCERAQKIPEKYRRDICTGCGSEINFPDHVFYPNFNSNFSEGTNDVSYTDGYGFARHKTCPRSSEPNDKFFKNLEIATKKLDEKWIKPSSRVLRSIKNFAYLSFCKN